MSRHKKQKRSGHYCWVCGRQRPNERFSGRGHARHICRDCAKLGPEELAYQQACRNLERCMTWEGIIPRKRRKTFEQYLQHDDPRIRLLAEQMQAEDRVARGRARFDAEYFGYASHALPHDLIWEVIPEAPEVPADVRQYLTEQLANDET